MSYYNSLIDLLIEVPSRFPKDAQEIYKEYYDKGWYRYKKLKDRQKKKAGKRQLAE